MNDGFQRVASLANVSEGQLVAVTAPNGDEVILVRIGRDVFAIEPVCSHQEAWLDAGEVHIDTCEVECPLHEGRFDLRTGEPTRPPPILPIKTYQVRLEGQEILIGPAKQPA